MRMDWKPVCVYYFWSISLSLSFHTITHTVLYLAGMGGRLSERLSICVCMDVKDTAVQDTYTMTVEYPTLVASCQAHAAQHTSHGDGLEK